MAMTLCTGTEQGIASIAVDRPGSRSCDLFGERLGFTGVQQWAKVRTEGGDAAMSSRTAERTSPRFAVIGVGLYTIPEAARLLGRHFNTVRSWVQKGLAPSPVHLAFGETTILSFHDLISLMVVARLRDEGVQLHNVRAAEDYLRTEWGFPRPFATERILTDGRSVFVALEKGGYTAVDRRGQEAFAEIIRELLHDVTYDARTRLADFWKPRGEIALRPDIQF
ncbi:MAG: MerR family transcriptional regulator, partial [Chloroflexota bacterium]|nr:MerR family transcriptional regulator [Chloroflexota bacterium]